MWGIIVFERCSKVINIIWCLSRISWGADRRSIKMIYQAMIRSVLDYGSMEFGSAAATTLQMLDVVQAIALQLCCGAFPTTPIPALLIEMEEVATS